MAPSRIAVVTGGNRGIGLEVCRQLHQAGLRVILTARDRQKASAAAEPLGLTWQTLDVGDPASIDAFARWATDELPAVDVLVNNAGLYSRAHVLEESMAEFRRVFEANSWGPLALAQHLLPGMRARGYGRVVNVSSGYGQMSQVASGPSAYCLSKLALGALTRMLAHAVDQSGVLVNAADPGWVRTEMGGPGAPRSITQGADTIVYLATLPADGPTGRLFHDRRPVAW